MKTWNVMLEGVEEGLGYLVSIEVAVESAEVAAQFAYNHALSLGYEITNIEEVEPLSPCNIEAPSVIRTLGRSFFENVPNESDCL